MRKLISGPSALICDECVDLCNNIIAEEIKEIEIAAKDSVAADASDGNFPNKTLQQAVKDGDAPCVKKIIANGASVDDTEGDTYGSPLHAAAVRGNLEIAELLLNAGANIDLKNTDIGATPLMKAADNGQVDMVKFLLDHGADFVLTNDDGATALMYARCTREDVRVAIVSILLAQGAR